MSVCTGAFVLASTGLLDGHPATTHHDFYRAFERRFPKVSVQRGKRFVEGPKLATAGGLTSGMDLALRVVERYFGSQTAERTAYYMEYQSEGWRDPTGAANAQYVDSSPAGAVAACPVCQMDAREGEFTHSHAGRTYHFCSAECRDRFAADPAPYAGSSKTR
jgi:YHS domain-containing protein